jgi:hypothetical protein
MHLPLLHVVPEPHTFPHEPQLLESFPPTKTSQPFAGFESQSAYPGSHATMVHAPFSQPAVAWESVHGALQDPQCAGSESRLVSQPSPVPLQSPNPVLQTYPQVPLQVTVALGRTPPAQSIGVTHPTQAPFPSQTPPLQPTWAETKDVPQAPFVQVRVWHSVSVPVQSLGVRQSTQLPVASQT